MTISMVVAAAENNVIGKDGKMPWHLPGDLKHFKNITWGFPVVMGRKTFESLGKALPGRMNIVLTRDQSIQFEDAKMVQDFSSAKKLAADAGVKELMIIGGGEIYKLLWEEADRIYITRILFSPDGDTFFPEIDKANWECVSSREVSANDEKELAHRFETWERKTKK